MDKSEFVRRLQLGFNNATAAPKKTMAEIKKEQEEQERKEKEKQGKEE